MPEFIEEAASSAISFAEDVGSKIVENAGSIATFAAKTALTIGISKLISNRQGTPAVGTQDTGARLQLPPSTDNLLPVVYGASYISPNITDAFISTDQTTMWYVMALCESTDIGTLGFAEFYSNNSQMLFDGGDLTRVAALRSNSSPPQDETRIDGNLYVYAYRNGSFSGVNTTLSAIDVLSDPAIPEASRWTSTDTMDNCCFIVVKMIYNNDAGTTSAGTISVKVVNTNDSPGSVIKDYMMNTRYGCAIPESKIDLVSLDKLDTYSNELIEYYDTNGDLQTQKRYQINGPINTGTNCLNNLQELADDCDSWLQYSELTGKWKIVINQSYAQAGLTFNDLFLVDSSNIIGGIDINPIDLNGTYNQLQVQFPNTTTRDQTDFKQIVLSDYLPILLSPNEPLNQLVVQFQQVNNYVQALYLGVRRLLQTREDLIINFALDYSGIQVEAGDIIRVTQEHYGWDEKLFRASQVQEAKAPDGTLGVRITAFEYNSTIYDDTPLQDFVPESNTGLSNPNIFTSPGTPTVTMAALTDGNVQSFSVSSTVPTLGNTLYMDFNYGLTDNANEHKLYSTVSRGDGSAYVPGETISISVADLPPNTYYWSTTARNNNSGSSASVSGTSHPWTGPNVTQYDKILDAGGCQISNMAPGAAGFALRTVYDMRSAISVPPPLVTATSVRNTPLIYPGTTVASTYYDTWRSGTWPYTFQATPSGLGPYVPIQAQSIGGYQSDFATLGWYLAIFVDLSQDTLTPAEWGVISGNFSITTDTANTHVQILRAPAFSTNFFTVQLRSLQDFILHLVLLSMMVQQVQVGKFINMGILYEM